MQADIKTICFISVFSGIINAAIPAGRMKNAFNCFCAVMVVFYMLLPLSDIKPEELTLSAFDDDKHDEALLSDVRTAEVMLFESLLEASLEEKLTEAGFTVRLKVICEKKDDEIRVLSVAVKGSITTQEREKVERIITDSFDGAAVSFEVDDNE